MLTILLLATISSADKSDGESDGVEESGIEEVGEGERHGLLDHPVESKTGVSF